MLIFYHVFKFDDSRILHGHAPRSHMEHSRSSQSKASCGSGVLGDTNKNVDRINEAYMKH